MRRALKKGLHTSIILSWYCLPKIRPRASHLYLHGRCEILGYIMNQMYTTALGGLLVLSPLSMAMAAEKSVFQLPKINVVANLVEQNNADTLAAVTVIDREEIERKQFNSLQDLLRTVPGVTFTNSGGYGKQTSVSIRGTNSKHVLVLVDGQRWNAATAGSSSFEFLPIEQIERVEVVKGPRSSLYGSEAIGGVIQIFTRKGTQEGIKPFASLTYGSHETYKANAGLNIKNNKNWANLSVAGMKTQGLDATAAPVETDKDGYENYSVSLNAGHQFNDQLSVDMNALHIEGETEIDNTLTSGQEPYTKLLESVYGVGLNYQANQLWNTKLKVGYSQDKQEGYIKTGLDNVYETQKETISWLNTLAFNKNHNLVLGTDYLKDKISGVNGPSLFDKKSRDNFGYFAQYLGNINNFDIEAALRLEDNEQYGDHTTGNVALGYQVNEALKTYVSYGTAFRAPTFNELYYPQDEWGGGNPNLNPEESENIELGFKGNIGNVNWALNGFRNDIDQMIVGWPAINVDKALIKGIEVELGQAIGQFDWNVNYTYQEPENRSGVNKGKQITNIPQQIFNLSADYNFDKWIVGGAVHAEDKRYSADNKSYMGSFATADVRLTYQATPDISVQAKLANMFDKEYQTTQGYNQDGRTAWVTLRYAMK